MDIYQFISSLVKSLAWPIALIVVILVLKKPINSLFLNISKLKYSDIEIDFDKTLNQVANNLDEATSNDVPNKSEKIQEDDRILFLAKTSPSALLSMAYSELEQEINKIVNDLGVKHVGKLRFITTAKLDLLIDRGYISKNTANSIMQLKRLRNEAVHLNSSETHITTENALEYYQLSQAIISNLQPTLDKQFFKPN